MKATGMILSLATVAMLGGCVDRSLTSTGAVNTEPLTVDAAMQKRTWDPVIASYENGDTPSWSNGFAYEADPSKPYWSYYYSDAGTYFVNLVTSPYTLYKERDGVASTGVQIPPSYTANPPIPPSATPADEVAPTTQPLK